MTHNPHPHGGTAEQVHAWSVAEFGVDHTHDITCRTWYGANWAGACDCTLAARTPVLQA